MIPIQISIENFMCYKERVADLNLGEVHVACLSGKNGHGKTALLDAITWVLWGKSRSRTQDELLHQGQDSMQVILDFSAQNQEYRATRIHTKGKGSSSGKTELNLEILSGKSAISIMGNTIRDTEQKIIQLLNLDYETFINTSYLKQGDADHFTKSKPTERKQILAEVLDLSYYEYLENISKERSKEFKDKVSNNKAILDAKLLDVPNKSFIEEKVLLTEHEIAKITPEEEKLTIYYSNLLSQKETANRVKDEHSRITISIKNSKSELNDLEVQQAKLTSEISELDKLIKRSGEITDEKSKLDNIKTILDKYDNDLILLKDHEKEILMLEQSINFEEQKILQNLNNSKTILEKELNPAVLEIEKLSVGISDINKNISHNDKELESLQSEIKELEPISHRIKELELENVSLESDMAETRKRFDILTKVDATCPICEQKLDINSKEILTAKLEESGLTSKQLYIKNKQELSKLQSQSDKSNLKINEKTKILNDLKKELDSKLIESNIRLENYTELIKKIPDIEREITDLTISIENKEFRTSERTKISSIKNMISALSYDGNEHAQMKNEYIKLQKYENLYHQLQEAKQRTEFLNILIDENKNNSLKRESDISIWESDLKKIEYTLEDVGTIDSNIDKTNKELESVRKNLQILISEKSILNNQIDTLKRTEKDIEDLETKIASDSTEIEIYDELAAAFGRNGIQALLIERAVPQIQNTANELLSKLTHHRMAIKLTFQKGRIDRLTGMHSEELDISISDEIGTRNYETFSGGETFRIDFAIRIALSKLLASRSGAPLPILFIDEGFGSQDTEGQEKLIEAIQSIQNEFEKIIVITHIDQMKENFDQRIEVIKTNEGSKIQIL